MKKTFTSLRKTTSAIVALVVSGMTFNASAEILSGNTASEIAGMMTTGWNLGNTFDATGGSNKGNSLDAETSWGQPKTTQEMITAVRKAGFNTIRIPVSWGKHSNFKQDPENFTINEEWMARVKEVVDYCYNEDLFVILNIHHDNNSGNIIYTLKDDGVSELFIKGVWRQIAEAFKDYDQHLIFEIMNEPRLVGTSYEWYFNPDKTPADVIPALEMLNKFNQIGVNEIRGNGSAENKDRVIMCPGYAACKEGCMTSYFQLPTDETPNRLALSLHAYRPYELCLGNSTMWYDSYKNDIKTYFKDVYEKFIVGMGVPVIIGEESCSARFDGSEYYNQEDRLEWVETYYSVTKEYGMPAVLWDNNVFRDNKGEAHGHFNRKELTWYDQEFIQKIMDVLGIESVENISIDYSLSIGPNPATNNIYVSSDNELQNIAIYSASGTRVMFKEISGNNAEIGISMLNRGIYNAVVKTELGINVIKLILK
ncbi:MAG: cellulase family glycosylhydrolase [Paludibacteraceae bacterium]|nr:cellulase family glycosylhydrolase [Paludibacteraceae bacterium]